MKKLKTKWFSKWAKKQNVTDGKLLEAIEDMQTMRSSTSLGGGLHKVRVALDNRGKSGVCRTIVVYRENDRAVMVYGFMKKERENLTVSELKSFKKLSKDILALDSKALSHAVSQDVLIEIKGDNDER